MEGLFSFVGIIIIIFSILQIILFFKMWGMTNDIKEIKNELVVSKDLIKIQLNKAAIKGDKLKIEEILFDSMFNDIQCFYNKSFEYSGGEEYFETQIPNIKKEYKEKYLKYNIDFPDVINRIEKRKDIDNL